MFQWELKLKGELEMKLSKNLAKIANKHDKTVPHSLDDAVGIVQALKFVKFDESVDLAINLDVDPRHADQMIRGAIALPEGTGKKVRVCVITSGDKIKLAEEAGADFVGGEEMVQKIQGGWLDFDRVIASPDMMGKLGRIGRVLGPRGLMPNPKTGTVTMDIAKAVSEVKAGKIDFKVDKTGIVHAAIGKVSFSADKIEENAKELLSTLIKLKPTASKGVYVKSIFMSSTMSPSIAVDSKAAVN